MALDIYRKKNMPAVAYQFAKRVTEIDPSKSIGWSNLAMLADNLYRFDEAEACFRKAEGMTVSDSDRANVLTNWACMLINKGDWQKAEVMARRALKQSPESAKCKMNLGLALLAQRKWREGWPLYDAVIGFDQSRRKMQYKNEPEWDGANGKRIVIYGEQGLGDEISFASMVPDAIRDSAEVAIDCTDRLQGLFQRSFPQANVLAKKPERIDASISIGALGKLYRNEDAAFTGEPYLKADPDRVEMWKGLFAKQGKPVYGIGWTGGVAWTADRFRKMTLEELLPLFRSVDAVWISLQYKDASKEIAAFKAKHPGIDIRQYPFGTLTQDYDDTAALVMALDHVVAMQSAVIHLAGALGKSCSCFVNRYPQWRYGADGDSMPWYRSVKLYRQGADKRWPLEQVAADL